MSNPKTIFLVLTCAMAIAGEVVRANTLVEVTIEEGRDFLARGKARLATAEEQEGAFPDAVTYPDEATARAASIAIVQEAGGSPVIEDAADAIVAGEGQGGDAPRADFEAVADVAVALLAALTSPQAQEGAQESAQAAPVVAAATPAPAATAATETPAKRAKAAGASKPA